MFGKVVLMSLLAAFTLLSAEVLAKKKPEMQMGSDAEISFDGLHRVDHVRMDQVWAKPGIDLSHYDAVMFANAGIQYRPVKDYRRNDRSAEFFPIEDKQRARLEDAVRDALVDEFKKFEHYKVVDQAGLGTLTVKIGLIDVTSFVPPEPMGRGGIYLKDLGQATLVLEVGDSVTGEVLARVVDTRHAESPFMQESNPVTNMSEVKRSVRSWGATVRKRLDDLHEIGCHACESDG